jgi:hypothetical protein
MMGLSEQVKYTKRQSLWRKVSPIIEKSVSDARLDHEQAKFLPAIKRQT